MAMAFRITTKGDVDVWSFFCIETAEADVKVLTVDASVRGRGIDSVPVSFIDERFGNPTNGVWYLARSQFEAVPMMPRVPWRSFVESECHTLTTSAGMMFGVLPRSFRGWGGAPPSTPAPAPNCRLREMDSDEECDYYVQKHCAPDQLAPKRRFFDK